MRQESKNNGNTILPLFAAIPVDTSNKWLDYCKAVYPNHHRSKTRYFSIVLGIIMVALAIVVVICNLAHGKSITTGENPRTHNLGWLLIVSFVWGIYMLYINIKFLVEPRQDKFHIERYAGVKCHAIQVARSVEAAFNTKVDYKGWYPWQEFGKGTRRGSLPPNAGFLYRSDDKRFASVKAYDTYMEVEEAGKKRRIDYDTIVSAWYHPDFIILRSCTGEGVNDTYDVLIERKSFVHGNADGFLAHVEPFYKGVKTSQYGKGRYYSDYANCYIEGYVGMPEVHIAKVRR